MTNNPQSTVTIPLSLGEIYAALCPACQKAVVDLVAAKAGPEFIRRAVSEQLDGRRLASPTERRRAVHR